jgi:hypothetical protein
MQARSVSVFKSCPSRRTSSISRLALFASVALTSRTAAAQTRWDMGAEAGAMDRIPTGGRSAATAPWPGPFAELHGHVALVPMVRLGAYVSEDLSEVAGRPVRHFTEPGIRLKVTPPLLRPPWRTWAFVGLGYALGYQPSYAFGPGDPTAHTASQRAAGEVGGILDLPFGVGVGLRVRAPWVVTAELAGRVGLMFTGAMYDPERCGCGASYLGHDSFAVALSVGVSLEQ